MLTISSPALAIFAMVPADRVDEVPVERLLANLERNAQGLEPAPKARAIGRLHLLAYLRRAVTLPVYRGRPDEVAEGIIDDCAKLDAQATGKGSRANFPPAKPGERCEARTYTLGPKREIPAAAFDGPARAMDQHLWAAIAAYERAREAEPSNLRGRVALAFAYDRAEQMSFARRELRYVMYQGLKQIQKPAVPGEPRSDWDTHTVVSEAAAHFDIIAKLWTDRRLLARVQRRLVEAPPARYITPILVPLKPQASFDELVDRTSTVAFDFSGQGPAMRAGWLTADAAWLVWDPKDKRVVTSGFQLFGSVTWVASWNSGYNALGALDDDGNGMISGAELEGLALWHDRDGDGVSDDGEVRPVATHGIVVLRYGHARVGDTLWISDDGVTFDTGETRPTYDWLLRDALIQAAD